MCKHEFTSGEHYCPGPGASYPSGTSLAQSFLLVTLPVTSTSMRYDRYDTCLYVRLGTCTRKCFANRTAEATDTFRRRASFRAGIIFFASDAREIALEQTLRAARRTCQRALLILLLLLLRASAQLNARGNVCARSASTLGQYYDVSRHGMVVVAIINGRIDPDLARRHKNIPGRSVLQLAVKLAEKSRRFGYFRRGPYGYIFALRFQLIDTASAKRLATDRALSMCCETYTRGRSEYA